MSLDKSVRTCSHSPGLRNAAFRFGGSNGVPKAGEEQRATRGPTGQGRDRVREVLSRPAGRVSHQYACRSAASLIALLGALAAVGVLAGPASAENVHVPVQTLTGFTVNSFNSFNQPRTVGVDSS